MLPYEVFLAGVSGTVLGALLGAWISARLTFDFQKRLLKQQLDFQKAQADLDAKFRKEMHDEQLRLFGEFRNMVNTRAAMLPARSGTNCAAEKGSMPCGFSTLSDGSC